MIFRQDTPLKAGMLGIFALFLIVLSVSILTAPGACAEKDNFLALWQLLKSNNPTYLISYESYILSCKQEDKIWKIRPLTVELEPVGWDKQGYRKQFLIKTSQLVELPRAGYLQGSANVAYDLAKAIAPKFSLELAWPLFSGPDLAGLEKDLNMLRQEESFLNIHNTMLLDLLASYFACINGSNEVQEKELALAIKERLLEQGEKRYSAGLIDRDELERLQIGYEQCRESLKGSKVQLQRSKERLFLLVGGEPVTITGDGLVGEYDGVLPQIENFMEQALEKRLDIAIMFLELEKIIAETAKNKALKGITGNIYLNYNYDEQLFGGPHFFKTGLVFSYRLFDKQGQENYLRSQAAAEIKQKQVELRLREMGFEIDAAYNNYFDLQENVRKAEGHCNTAEEDWQRERRLLERGDSSPYQVDLAYLEYISKRNHYHKMRQTLVLQYLKIEKAMGEILNPETWTWLQNP